jgi:hypothetical protein
MVPVPRALDVAVNLIVPYNIKHKNAKKPLTLWAVTMIDPATGWFEIASIDTKRANVSANTVKQTWFTRNPWPSQVMLDLAGYRIHGRIYNNDRD